MTIQNMTRKGFKFKQGSHITFPFYKQGFPKVPRRLQVAHRSGLLPTISPLKSVQKGSSCRDQSFTASHTHIYIYGLILSVTKVSDLIGSLHAYLPCMHAIMKVSNHRYPMRAFCNQNPLLDTQVIHMSILLQIMLFWLPLQSFLQYSELMKSVTDIFTLMKF